MQDYGEQYKLGTWSKWCSGMHQDFVHFYYIVHSTHSPIALLQVRSIVFSSQAHHVTRPTVDLPIHCCQTAFHVHVAACTTTTIRNWTPESDWKHKKTSSINCTLQTKVDWTSVFPVSYSYRHQSSLITYIAKLQQSVTQSARKSLLCFFSSKFQVKKVLLISAVPALPGNMSGENIKCWSCDRSGESMFSCRKPQQLRMPARSTDAKGIDIT